MSGPPPNQPGGPTATDEEIFEAYRSNEAESEPEDVEELPTVAPAARPRAAKRKKPQQVDEDDGYGSDLYYDEDDRAELMAKTQLEREMILAKRAEERINRTERQKLLAKSKDDEPAPKPPARKRPDAKRQAIADIRKAQQRKKTASTKAARARDADEEYEDVDEEASDEEEGDDDDEYRVGGRDEDVEEEGEDEEQEDDDEEKARNQNANHNDILSVQLTRNKLEEWANKPFFLHNLRNSVVRIAATVPGKVGPDSRKYLMAVVVNVTEEEGRIKNMDGRYLISPYAVNSNSKEKTNRWLNVRRGAYTRMVSLSLISNSKITEEEFEHFQNQCIRDGEELPKVRDIQEAQELHRQAENYTFNAEDVKQLLEKKRQRGWFSGSTGAERLRLQRLLKDAQMRQDVEAIWQLQEQMTALELLESRRKGGKDDKNKGAIEAINKKNANINFQNMLKSVGNRPDGVQGGAGEDQVDVFSRRKTQPVVMIKPQKVGVKEQADQDSQDPNVQSPSKTITTPSKKAVPMKMASLDVLPDLDIDLSRLHSKTPMTPLARALLGGCNWHATLCTATDGSKGGMKQTMTLDEYKRRMGS